MLRKTLATVSVGLSIAGAAAAAPPPLPDTANSVGLAQAFVYKWTQDQYANRLATRQVIWSNSPGSTQGGAAKTYIPPGAISSFYFAVTRVPVNVHVNGKARIIVACGLAGGGGCTLAWFQTNHPNWIVYKHDQRTPAYAFGDTTWIPLDIANPAVRAWIETNYFAPVLATGTYNAISVDNVSDRNSFDEEGVCSIKPVTGCTDDGGAWTRRYSGAVSDDPAFLANRVAWLRAITAYAHAHDAVSMANITYDPANRTGTARLISAADIWYDEQGFNGDAAPAGCEAGGGAAYKFYDAYWTGKVAFINGLNGGAGWPMVQELAGCAPTIPASPATRAVMDYALASYCLTKTAHSWVMPYSIDAASFSDVTPELRVVHGPALEKPPTGGDAAGIWHRRFARLECIVNPSSKTAARFTLPEGQWRDFSGALYRGVIALPPITGKLLVPETPNAR